MWTYAAAKGRQDGSSHSSGLKIQQNEPPQQASLLGPAARRVPTAREGPDDDDEYDEESDSESQKNFNDALAKFSKKYPNEAIETKISQEQGITYSGKQMLFDYIEDGFWILDAHETTQRAIEQRSEQLRAATQAGHGKSPAGLQGEGVGSGQVSRLNTKTGPQARNQSPSRRPTRSLSAEELHNLQIALAKDGGRLERLAAIRKEYLTNVMLIFNAFFEYGLINS